MKSLLKFNLNFQLPNNKPLPQAGAYCFILGLLYLFSSCSSITIPIRSKKSDLASGAYVELSGHDYSDHLASLKAPFLATPGVKTVKMPTNVTRYLNTLLNDILSNNEIFFKELKNANITVLDYEAPLHFSLPKGSIFLSKGLITKYIKHESMLVSILSYELVKSEKLLYPKQTIIPTGFVTLDKMLALNRLSLDEKMEIHKWAHHITVRSGYDGEYYLSWLQTQNRNTADFMLQVGDANLITREESLFKAFLIKNMEENEQVASKKNSSKTFYSFINSIRDGVL